MKLLLKFFYKDKLSTRIVMSPAVISEWGQYQDARYIYTEEGKYEKRFCQGIQEIWQEELEESSQG